MQKKKDANAKHVQLNPSSFAVFQTGVREGDAWTGKQELRLEVNREVCHTNWQLRRRLPGESAVLSDNWRSSEMDKKKKAFGRPSRGVKVTGRASRKSSSDAGRQKKHQSDRKQQWDTHVLIREAKHAVLSTGRGGPASEVVALRWGVSLQGASDPPWRWSVNADFNAAGSELPGAALPGGFKGCSGSQISVIRLPESLIFKNIFDFFFSSETINWSDIATGIKTF